MRIRFFPIILNLIAISLLHQAFDGTLTFAADRKSHSETADAARGLLLPQERQVEQFLEAARKALDAEDFGTAAVILLQVLDWKDDVFVATPDDATLGDASGQALLLASRLPAPARQRFEADLDRMARDAWATAREIGTDEALAAFARKHLGSAAGLDALRLLAASHRDSGRHMQAAQAWHQASIHPRATASQRTVSTMASIASLLAAGNVDEAERVAEIPGWIAAKNVTLAGQSVVPEEWVAAQLKRGRAGQVPAAAAISRVPAQQPAWTRDTSAIAELQKSISQIQLNVREQGIVSAPAIRPVLSGNVVLTRTLQDVAAFDLTSGEPLWSVPNHESAWLSKFSSLPENSPVRTTVAAAASEWHRRLESDSVFGTLTTNGAVVAAVHEPARPHPEIPMSNAQGRGAAAAHVAGTRWNRLCAYEIANHGALKWQIGGAPTGPADVYGGITFLGPPLFVDDLLFAVVRREDELNLLAIDLETGHLRWSVKLGVLAPHLADAAVRRRIACPVTLCGGRLLCPTASGTLVAVDPTLRTVDWAYRYSIVQHDVPTRPTNGTSMATMSDAWWDEWRDVTCLVTNVVPSPENDGSRPTSASRVILLTSPDSGELHAIRPDDGSRVWSIARAGAMTCIGSTGTSVILGEPMAVRSHDLRTGRLNWRTETGEVSGRGVVDGKQIIQSLRTGGFAVIDAGTGRRSPGFNPTDVAFGNLAASKQGWISQTDSALQLLPFLETLRLQAARQLETQSGDAAAIHLANLDLQAGDATAARQRLAHVESAEGKVLKRDALTALLRSPAFAKKRPERTELIELNRELLGLCETDEERLLAYRDLGNASRDSGDPAAAVNDFLDGLDLIDQVGVRSLGEWRSETASAAFVRPDRVFLGLLDQVLAEQTTEARKDLENLLRKRLDVATESGDPFATQRLLERMLPLDWARRAILENPNAAHYARPLLKVELALLSVSGSPDKFTAATSLDLLSQTMSRSGWRTEAEGIQRRILAKYADVPLEKGLTLTERLAADPDLADLRGRLLAPPADPWRRELPKAEKLERDVRRNLDIHQVTVKIQASPGSLLDRLDVAVDRMGRFVRFSGDGYSGSWQMPLPPAPKVLRSRFAHEDQVEGYGIGRLLILRVGSEVYGILPFNERGEASASTTGLQLDIAPHEAHWYPEPVPAKLGIRHESVRLIDGFGRPLGGLGPVRAGYVCYRSQAKLVAIDTHNGKRLWERLDLPSNCQVTGDDDQVYLWRNDEAQVQTLSSIDGRLLSVAPMNFVPDDVLMHSGSQVWSVERKPSIGIAMHDLRDGQLKWNRQFPQTSIPFAIDQETVGLLEPDGTLRLLAAATGAEVGKPMKVEMPGKVERIVALHDGWRWYIAISGPVPRLPSLLAAQPWVGLRMSFVNGWLYAIDRQTAAISWKRQLESEPLLQTAPRTAPVIVQMWRRPAGEEPGSSDMGVLKLIDTRTGQEIMTHKAPSLQPYFALYPSANRDTLDVLTERESFRLTYNPVPQENPPEQPSPKQ